MSLKIGDLFVKLGLKKDEFDKGLKDAKQQTSMFSNSIKAIGGAIAGAFAASAIIQFGKEVFNIALQAEGVQKAFKNIATEGDLQGLRDSVKGTVSDLELMKRAVQAQNFGIPVQQLGKLFEFASKRAQDTGQSVDYLVDSIVMGIGRKSPLILDNLGISAIQLKEKLHGVGLETASVADITRAVGEIAEESFRKSGKFAETLGTSVQTLNASWENFKLTLSGIFSDSGFLKQLLDSSSKMLQTWSSKNATFLEKILATLSPDAAIRLRFQAEIDYKDLEAKLKKTSNDLPEVNVFGKGPKAKKSATEQLSDLRKINDELEAQRILTQNINRGGAMSQITPIGTPSSIPNEPIEFSAVFGNLDSSYEAVSAKNKKFTEEFLQDWKTFTTDLNQVIQQGIGEAITSLASGFGEMIGTGEWDWSNFGAGILQSIGKFMTTLGGLFVAYGIANLKFVKALMAGPTPLGAGLAIAAGVGLIAAGSAISSFAKKGVSGGSGGIAASGYTPSSGSSAVAAISGNVVFELAGTTLRGVLNNQDRKNSLIR